MGHAAAVVRPGSTRRGRGRGRRLRRRRRGRRPPGRQHRPGRRRRSRSTARWCSACAGSTSSGRSTGSRGQVTAGAGATHRRGAGARRRGRAGRTASTWPPGTAATVGGMVATNAGGLPFVRHGAHAAPGARRRGGARPTGAVVSHLGGLEKDNTGYDLAGLLCGSEGTLGVVTAARLRLVAPADERVTALLGVRRRWPMRWSPPARCAAACRRSRPPSCSSTTGWRSCATRLGFRRPFPGAHRCYLLVECGAADGPDRCAGRRRGRARRGVADVAVAADAPRRAELWRYREAHTEAINALGPPAQARRDAARRRSSPRSSTRLPRASRRWPPALGRGCSATPPTATSTSTSPASTRRRGGRRRRADASWPSAAAASAPSTASARPSGAGCTCNRSPAELAAMRAIKAALDPAGILNPGVLLPDP